MPYIFADTPHGFVITHTFFSHGAVAIELTDTALAAHTLPADMRQAFGLFDYYELVHWVVEHLRSFRMANDTSYYKRAWMTRAIGQWIGKEFHRRWRQLLDHADPTVVALQRAVFAATFRAPSLLMAPALYSDPWLTRDIRAYRAAACAVRLIDDAINQPPEDLGIVPVVIDEQQLGAHIAQRQAALLDPGEAIARLRDWRAFFSATGRPYTSLNKTLDRLPRMPFWVLATLLRVRLERPIISRLELLLVLLGTEHDVPMYRRRHRRVFMQAREADIREAMRRVAAHTHNVLRPHRVGDVQLLVGFLSDYPEEHRGTIVGLADKSIAWHRHAQQRVRQRQIEMFGEDHPTTTPPIPIPDLPGVRWLATVAEVVEEGALMGHCIASYAHAAATGGCYLFHIDHGQEQASVEIDACGRVRQSFGPGNQRNAAALWGAQVLAEWGSAFPKRPPQAGAAEYQLDPGEMPPF